MTMMTLGLASLCYGTAAGLACRWYIPLIRQASQASIHDLILRLGEIGYPEEQLRKRAFLIETVLLIVLLWLSWIYMGFVLGATVLAVGYHLRGMLLDWTVEHREHVLREQTLGFTTALQGLVRGGLGLSSAIEMLARETPEPLGTQIAKISGDFRHGRPLIDSLVEVRERMKLDAFSLLATSISCALRQGASLESSLGGVLESLEHRSYAERQLRTKTSAARNTILILSFTPIGFFLMFWLVMPGSMGLIFTTPHGKWMVAAILALMYTGVAWARRLLVTK